jgi:hypothetical protein
VLRDVDFNRPLLEALEELPAQGVVANGCTGRD